jgi:hypothetical protein
VSSKLRTVQLRSPVSKRAMSYVLTPHAREISMSVLSLRPIICNSQHVESNRLDAPMDSAQTSVLSLIRYLESIAQLMEWCSAQRLSPAPTHTSNVSNRSIVLTVQTILTSQVHSSVEMDPRFVCRIYQGASQLHVLPTIATG